jgi:hypothetical protein
MVQCLALLRGGCERQSHVQRAVNRQAINAVQGGVGALVAQLAAFRSKPIIRDFVEAECHGGGTSCSTLFRSLRCGIGRCGLAR